LASAPRPARSSFEVSEQCYVLPVIHSTAQKLELERGFTRVAMCVIVQPE
jgi:hypothetical protein